MDANPDPDRLWGPSHGYSSSTVKMSSQSELCTHTQTHTGPITIPFSPLGARITTSLTGLCHNVCWQGTVLQWETHCLQKIKGSTIPVVKNGTALLPLALGTLNLCMAWWHQKAIKAFWSKMYILVSQLLGAQWRSKTNPKNAPRAKEKNWTIWWPANSPGLNPTEHMWKELKLTVWRQHPSNLTELKQFAQEERTKLSVQKCRHLIPPDIKCLTTVIVSTFPPMKY